MNRVLVVEDEYALRRILTLNLAQRGYTVAEAGSVAEAVEAVDLSGYTFDVILLDINLPDQTGWDLLRHLAARDAKKAAPQRSPAVIVLTAVRPAQSRLDEFHPAAVLLKPFPISALLRLVERVVVPETASERLAQMS